MKSRFRWFLVVAGALLLAYLVDQWRRSRLEFSQDKNILAAAKRYDVDPALIKAVVWKESRFDPRARGTEGELGLMQIMPDAAADWAGAQRLGLVSDSMLFSPEKNIDCGAWHLRKLLGRYRSADDPIPYALAAYNAGHGNALKWAKGSAATNSAEFIEQIGFPSTQQYVRDVMKRRERYRDQFPSGPD